MRRLTIISSSKLHDFISSFITVHECWIEIQLQRTPDFDVVARFAGSPEQIDFGCWAAAV